MLISQSKSKLLFFLAVMLLVSCKKDKTVLPGTSQQYYIKGALNGTSFDWEADNKNWGTGYGMTTSTDQNNNQVAELQAMISSYSSKQATPSIGIGFRTFQVGNQDQTALTAYFNGFIITGNWNYAVSDALTGGVKQIVIYYNDTNGNSYSSAGVQTGSTATITSVKQVTSASGIKSSLDIKLTFSCTLYNLDGYSPSITLTNAQANINLPDVLY